MSLQNKENELERIRTINLDLKDEIERLIVLNKRYEAALISIRTMDVDDGMLARHLASEALGVQ